MVAGRFCLAALAMALAGRFAVQTGKAEMIGSMPATLRLSALSCSGQWFCWARCLLPARACPRAGDGGVIGGRLADLIERRLHQSLEPERRHAHPHLAAAVVPASVAQRRIGYDEQGIRHPVDARHARERVVNRRRECSDRDLDDLRDAEFAVLLQNAVSPEPHVSLDQCFEVGEAVGRPDTGEWLASQYELSGPVKEVNYGVRPHGRIHQSRTVDLLNVTAMLARDSLPFGYLQRDDLRTDLFAASLLAVGVHAP